MNQDCVVVLPQNDPAIVDLLISTLGWSPETQVLINEDGDTLNLEEALTSHFEITKLTKPLIENAAIFLIMKSFLKKFKIKNGFKTTLRDGFD